jgi:hypothetical protein
MRNQQSRIRFPVFNGFEVRVIIARDIQATGRRLDADLTGCAAAFITNTDKPKRGWIVFGVNPDEATIAHEASHAVRAIMRYAGARVEDEVFAYHLDYLVGKIHKFLKRGNK